MEAFRHPPTFIPYLYFLNKNFIFRSISFIYCHFVLTITLVILKKYYLQS